MTIKTYGEGGIIWYKPSLLFHIFHHCSFIFNENSGEIEYNNNPYGESKLLQIKDFTILEDGFSFLKKNQKRVTKYKDVTPFEKSLTNYLYNYITNFSFLEDYFTGFHGGWSPTGALSAKFISRKNGFEPSFLSFNRDEDRLYTGSPPLIEKNQVIKISFKPDRIVLLTSQGVVDYECKIQPDIYDFIRFYFKTGYDGLLNIEE